MNYIADMCLLTKFEGQLPHSQNETRKQSESANPAKADHRQYTASYN